QHRAVMGERARRIEMDVALLQSDLPARRTEIAGQHSQQRRFAGAVGADDRDHFAGRNAQIDAVDQRGAADHHRDRLRFENGGHSETSPRWRSSIPRKNGAPIAAVRMPIGISAGATMVRASVSAPTISAAPNSIEAGSSSRCAGPIISRSRCGTTMPTKPTTPQTETATPVIADTSTIEIRFSRSTSTPLLNASASPNTSTSSPRAIETQAIKASPSTGASVASLGQVAPLSEPSSQNVMSRNWRSSAMNTKSPTPALAMAAIAMPPSRKIAIDGRPERLAIEYRMILVPSEPAKA